MISMQGVSKSYTIAHKYEGPGTLRDTLARRLKNAGRTTKETFWALRDVSLEIKSGEVVGIIGKNGAGKSTLLKILSRITEPTAGRVELYGRVGSLLEVGTGFHPELTGRENIFLNGTILGMRRPEINRFFEAIVEFAGVEKFLDTPVKRYSSGMYVRLAFAVAAHLQSEILVVDEVLAVGDAEFQQRCLGKMEEVAKGGRTVLFVSHNMQAVQALCTRAIRMHGGRVAAQGHPQSVIAEYLAGISEMGSQVRWPADSAPGNDDLRLTALCVHSGDGRPQGTFSSRKNLCVDIDFVTRINHPGLCIGFDLVNPDGVTLFRTYQSDLAPKDWPPVRLGENRWRCVLPGGLLNGGMFYLCPKIGLHNTEWIVDLEATVRFEIILDHGVSPLWNVLDNTNRPGLIAPIFNWESREGVG